jgi:hypothetical protein
MYTICSIAVIELIMVIEWIFTQCVILCSAVFHPIVLARCSHVNRVTFSFGREKKREVLISLPSMALFPWGSSSYRNPLTSVWHTHTWRWYKYICYCYATMPQHTVRDRAKLNDSDLEGRLEKKKYRKRRHVLNLIINSWRMARVGECRKFVSNDDSQSLNAFFVWLLMGN